MGSNITYIKMYIKFKMLKVVQNVKSIVNCKNFKVYAHFNVISMGSHNTQIGTDCTLNFYKLA